MCQIPPMDTLRISAIMCPNVSIRMYGHLFAHLFPRCLQLCVPMCPFALVDTFRTLVYISYYYVS